MVDYDTLLVRGFSKFLLKIPTLYLFPNMLKLKRPAAYNWFKSHLFFFFSGLVFNFQSFWPISIFQSFLMINFI